MQGVSDNMNCTLLSGSTPTSSTGPTGDHTGGGNYVYTESSSPNNPAKVAELYGPCIDLSSVSGAELGFWYHLYGATMGTLNVDIWNGSAWTLGAWTLSGNQGNSWQQATVSLNAYVGGSVRVRFRGITGTGSTSDMAIDDILISGASEVQVAVKVALEGAYDATTGLMRDDLRALTTFPLTEPYTALGYVHAGGGGGEAVNLAALSVSGANAIVDWIVVELRSVAAPSTVLASRWPLCSAMAMWCPPMA